MNNRTRTIAFGAVAVAVVAAVAAVFFMSPPSGNEFSNVRALAAALEDAGLSCDQLNVSAPNPTEDIVDFASCQMDGKTVNLHVYNSRDAVAEHIEGNVSARELNNPNYFTSLVAGPNWVVDTYSDRTTQKIQEAIGGEIH